MLREHLLGACALFGLMATYEATHCCSDYAVMVSHNGQRHLQRPPFKQPLAEAGVTSADKSTTADAKIILIAILSANLLT